MQGCPYAARESLGQHPTNGTRQNELPLPARGSLPIRSFAISYGRTKKQLRFFEIIAKIAPARPMGADKTAIRDFANLNARAPPMVRIRTPMAGKGPTLPLRLVLRALQPQVLTRWDVRVVGGGVLQTSSFQRGLGLAPV